jgi:carbon storage regulator
MMVMRRREGEKILIGDDIVIHISHIGRNKVKIAIDAPRELLIVAEEMKAVREENLAAATPLDVNLLHRKIFPQTLPSLNDK